MEIIAGVKARHPSSQEHEDGLRRRRASWNAAKLQLEYDQMPNMSTGLSKWVEMLLPEEQVSSDSFFHQLSDGVILCKLAIRIQAGMERIDPSIIPFCILYHSRDRCLRDRSGFYARENVQQFLAWCRHAAIRPSALFESNQCVLLHQEVDCQKDIVNCLCHVSRRAAAFGFPEPDIPSIASTLGISYSLYPYPHERDHTSDYASPMRRPTPVYRPTPATAISATPRNIPISRKQSTPVPSVLSDLPQVASNGVGDESPKRPLSLFLPSLRFRPQLFQNTKTFRPVQIPLEIDNVICDKADAVSGAPADDVPPMVLSMAEMINLRNCTAWHKEPSSPFYPAHTFTRPGVLKDPGLQPETDQTSAMPLASGRTTQIPIEGKTQANDTGCFVSCPFPNGCLEPAQSSPFDPTDNRSVTIPAKPTVRRSQSVPKRLASAPVKREPRGRRSSLTLAQNDESASVCPIPSSLSFPVAVSTVTLTTTYAAPDERLRVDSRFTSVQKTGLTSLPQKHPASRLGSAGQTTEGGRSNSETAPRVTVRRSQSVQKRPAPKIPADCEKLRRSSFSFSTDDVSMETASTRNVAGPMAPSTPSREADRSRAKTGLPSMEKGGGFGPSPHKSAAYKADQTIIPISKELGVKNMTHKPTSQSTTQTSPPVSTAEDKKKTVEASKVKMTLTKWMPENKTEKLAESKMEAVIPNKKPGFLQRMKTNIRNNSNRIS